MMSGCKHFIMWYFCLVPWDILSHYPGDANQNYRPHRHVQGAPPRGHSLALYPSAVAALRSTTSAPTDDQRGRIDPRLGHVVAEAGTLAQHVKQLTGKDITDGALAQRRA